MAAFKRYSVAKTERSYDPTGLAAIKGSTVYSSTEEYNTNAYPPASDQNGDRVPPTS
tara:strand:- start:4641 stop:4811 length:171 start_codon:yes stop_codon:yes gene_type:complete